MVVVSVCVGSSCHMKGSYQVIKTFQELIKKNQLEDVIELKASFCMGRCLSATLCNGQRHSCLDVGFVMAKFIKDAFPSTG